MPAVTKTTAAPVRKPVAKTGDVWDRVKPMSFPEDMGIRIMLYGRGGTGKTTLWGSFPGPILVGVCSGGKESGELLSLNTPENRDGRIMPVDLLKPDELTTLADGAKAKGFKTIVLDHVSGFQDLVLGEITGKPVPEQKSWGFATQQEYGATTARCKEHLRHLLDSGLNVVIIGHERENERKEDSELVQPHIGVEAMPKLAGWLNGAVDYIAQTLIRNAFTLKETKIGEGKAAKVIQNRVAVKNPNGSQAVEYCLRTEPSEIFMTKFRIPKGTGDKGIIVDPSYDKIMAAIRGTPAGE